MNDAMERARKALRRGSPELQSAIPCRCFREPPPYPYYPRCTSGVCEETTEFVAAVIREVETRAAEYLKAKHDLSNAYLRLRAMIPGAFDTPHAPTSEQVWETTENALKELVLRADR